MSARVRFLRSLVRFAAALSLAAACIPEARAIDIGLGEGETCRVDAAGAATCWGSNAAGQLGTNDGQHHASPTPVVGLSSGVLAIDMGRRSTCALTTGGAVLCWGGNEDGQLGVGGGGNRALPTPVTGLGSGVVAISVGGFHACAIAAGGVAKCWGSDNLGQLGTDAVSDSASTPVDVAIGPVIAITAGYQHTCAVTTTGAALCWGANFSGMIGDGTTQTRMLPVPVTGLASGVAQIDANSHTCALTTAGAMFCWGQNFHGEIGDGSRIPRYSPRPVTGLSSGVAEIETGFEFSCARLAGGSVKCWGASFRGQTGDGITTNEVEEDRHVPADVLGVAGAVRIGAGLSHACAMQADGRTRCWGSNDIGELGIGDARDHNLVPPTLVANLGEGAVAIDSMNAHNCVVTTAGAAKC